MAGVAFVSCARRGSEPDADGGLLRPCLRSRGIEDVWVPWDDPAFTWHDVSGCVVKSTWDYYRRPAAFTAWAATTAQRTRIWNSAADLTRNCHKSYLLALAAAGVPVVPTVLASRDSNGPAALEPQSWDEIVVKPAVSVGALRTERFRRGDAAAATFLDGILAAGDVLIQPYLPAIAETGEISLVYLDGVFSHAVRKWPPPGSFAAQPHLGGRVERCRPADAELAVAAAALRGTDAPLHARVDLVEHDGAPVVMELELIEPALFLEHAPEAAATFADALVRRLDEGPPRSNGSP
jgi:glutathione synthase/RimK-type ligase-like ATP-grasp enzyme